MCFEWDKRYFRELEEKKSKDKVDELIKNAEDAADLNRGSSAMQDLVHQHGGHKESALT